MNPDKFLIRIISDKNNICRIEKEWNDLVSRTNSNPFLLSTFTRQFADHIHAKWALAIIVISYNNKIVGIVPLQTQKNIVGQRFEFLHPYWCSELIFDEIYRSICVEKTLDFLFNIMSCKFVNFNLPGESPNFKLIKQKYKTYKLSLKIKPEMAHRIIPLKCGWSEFEAQRHRAFKRKLQRLQRNLNRAGLCTTVGVYGDETANLTKKILEVEERSWKQNWRTTHGQEETDLTLATVLKASQQSTRTIPEFKWKVRFLELDNNPIAYLLVIEYKGVSYLVKTSYDEKYRKFCPGILVQHFEIQDNFNRMKSEKIDFLSDLLYMQAWTDKCIPRVRAFLTKGPIPTAIQSTMNNQFTRKMLSTVMSKF